MAKSEAVKLAEIEERKQLEKMLFELLTHPIPLAVLGFYLSDRLQGDWVYKTPYLGTYEGQEAWIKEKYWDSNAGKLNSGAALALQAGMGAYLSSGAVGALLGSDGISGLIGAVKGPL